MGREEALRLLKQQQRAMEQFDVKSLAIFGSVARDEAGPDSDIDVLVDFHHGATFNGYFDVKELLEKVLNIRIDLVTEDGLRDIVRKSIAKDIIYVT